jgi:hypothetical protein
MDAAATTADPSVANIPSPEQASQAAKRRQQKADEKLKKRLGDFTGAVEDVRKQQDLVKSHSGAAAAVAKERRRALREIVKVGQEQEHQQQHACHVAGTQAGAVNTSWDGAGSACRL